MKNKIVILSLIAVLAFSSIISAASIEDVPKDHWAYDSVKNLVDKGLLQLYEDGTFRGADKVSRFQLAEIVAKILEEMDSGQVRGSQEDIEELYKLTAEFQNELVALASQGEYFKERIKELEQKNISQDEFMTELRDVQYTQNEVLEAQKEAFNTQIKKLEETIQEIQTTKEDIKNTKEEVSNIENDVSKIIENILKIKQLEEELANLKSIHDDLAGQTEEFKSSIDKKISDLYSDVDSMKNEINKVDMQITDQTIQGLEDKISINSTRLSSLQDELNQVKTELKGKEEEVEELKGKNDEYKNLLYGVAAVAAALLLFSN